MALAATCLFKRSWLGCIRGDLFMRIPTNP